MCETKIGLFNLNFLVDHLRAGSIIIVSSVCRIFVLRWLLWNIEALCIRCQYARVQNCSCNINAVLEGGAKGGGRVRVKGYFLPYWTIFVTVDERRNYCCSYS